MNNPQFYCQQCVAEKKPPTPVDFQQKFCTQCGKELFWEGIDNLPALNGSISFPELYSTRAVYAKKFYKDM